jgi:hypothetical protein
MSRKDCDSYCPDKFGQSTGVVSLSCPQRILCTYFHFQWVIVNYSDGANQSVSPMEAQNLQCGPSGAVIAVLPYNSYVYWIRGGGGAPYTYVFTFSSTYRI